MRRTILTIQFGQHIALSKDQSSGTSLRVAPKWSSFMKLLKFLALLFVVNISSWLLAQTTGSITGVVTDPSGAVVPGARVTATEKNTGSVRTITTNSSGFYSLTNLAPGIYKLAVAKEGFKGLVIDDNQLTVAQALVVNPQLPVGSLQETVEVNGAAAAPIVGSSRVDLQACKLEYSIVSPK